MNSQTELMPDSDNSIDGLSQIKEEGHSHFKDIIIHVAIGAIVLVIILAMIFSAGKKQQPTEVSSVQKIDYNADLQSNLAKLRAENANTQKAPIALAPMESSEEPPLSRDVLARQNAPTNMYSFSNNQNGTFSNSSNSPANPVPTSSLVFAGDSPFNSFANQDTQTGTLSATRILHPRVTIASGEFMHAILETAINSDLPGMVRAVISQPVYAYIGEAPLIPAGSRLMGQYSSMVFQGQKRVFIVWNRVILPNGITVQINSPSTDSLGMAGQGADTSDTHFFERFGTAALLSVIGAGVSSYDVNPADNYNSSSMYRAAIAQSFQQSAQQSLQNSTVIKPTLTINQGAEINVFVAHDLSFYNVLHTSPGIHHD